MLRRNHKSDCVGVGRREFGRDRNSLGEARVDILHAESRNSTYETSDDSRCRSSLGEILKVCGKKGDAAVQLGKVSTRIAHLLCWGRSGERRADGRSGDEDLCERLVRRHFGRACVIEQCFISWLDEVSAPSSR